ncbi:unnamed protein product [Closterium sp. NIES-54]
MVEAVADQVAIVLLSLLCPSPTCPPLSHAMCNRHVPSLSRQWQPHEVEMVEAAADQVAIAFLSLLCLFPPLPCPFHMVVPNSPFRQWQPHEVEMVEAVADQVAIALSHAAALEESQVGSSSLPLLFPPLPLHFSSPAGGVTGKPNSLLALRPLTCSSAGGVTGKPNSLLALRPLTCSSAGGVTGKPNSLLALRPLTCSSPGVVAGIETPGVVAGIETRLKWLPLSPMASAFFSPLPFSPNPTQRRREEMAEQNAALQVARIKAEEAIQARNDFLSVMNHEMRSPLHTILALSSLMEEDDLTDEQGPMVATLSRSASMLTSLISDVIGVAQRQEIKMLHEAASLAWPMMRAKGLSFSVSLPTFHPCPSPLSSLVLEHRPFDLRRMLHDAASLAWPMMRAKGLSFSVVIAREVPRHVVGDERRLLRVVLHIIGHAIDSTDEVSRRDQRASRTSSNESSYSRASHAQPPAQMPHPLAPHPLASPPLASHPLTRPLPNTTSHLTDPTYRSTVSAAQSHLPQSDSGDVSAAAAVESAAALAAIEAPRRSPAEDLREAEAAEAERERQARISEQFVAPSCAICQKLLLLMDGHYWNATQAADPGAATAFSVRLLCDRTRRRHRRRRHMMCSLEGSGDEGSGSEEDGEGEGDGEDGSDGDESSCSIGAYIEELEGIRVLVSE